MSEAGKEERQEWCGTCYFFERQMEGDGEETEYGTCRRYPPKFSDAMLYTLGVYQRDQDYEGGDSQTTWETMLDVRDDSTNFAWPKVNTSNGDWCGEYKPKDSYR